jgi:hypothetical protein
MLDLLDGFIASVAETFVAGSLRVATETFMAGGRTVAAD